MANSAPEFNIDEAQITDAPRLATLCIQLGYPASKDDIIKRLEDLRDDQEQVTFVARTPRGEVIGWIGAFLRKTLMVDKHVQISGLVVDEVHRGQGIGEQLVEAVECWAGEHGCKTIFVRSNVNRTGAHRFYARLGYQQIKTSRTFKKEVFT
jgi:GNAT superfamily N-acetyltransferase